MNIVTCYPLESNHADWLQAAMPNAHFIHAGQEHIASAIHEADIFVGHAKVPIEWDRVVQQGRLKFIQSSAAGLDHCLVPEVIDSEIRVASASGLFANQVAEQTFALLLGLLRSAPVFFRQSLRREYVRRPTNDLHGKKIGLVGLGGNGRRIAELLSGFHTEVRAVDYFPVMKPDCVVDLRSHDQLEWLAKESDVLILTLPLNASTFHCIDGRILDAMPSGSYLINVARGRCVNESALIERLQNQHLAGAGLDVAEVEPLPPESPLWELDNVIITPHVGAQSARRVDDSTRLACENLKRFTRDEVIINEVDKTLGFPQPERLARNFDYDR